MRLLAAFLIVSILPISILGYLSWRESGGSSEESSTEGAHSAEEIFGMSTATVELAVAAAGLLLSIGMALIVARTSSDLYDGCKRRCGRSSTATSTSRPASHRRTSSVSWL